MKCLSCEFENRQGVRFCENCGERLFDKSSESISVRKPQISDQEPKLGATCQHCGFSNRMGVSFCENCGEQLQMTPARKHSEIRPHTIPKKRGAKPWVTVTLAGVSGLCLVIAFASTVGLFAGINAFLKFDLPQITGADDENILPVNSTNIYDEFVEPELSIYEVHKTLEDSAVRADPEIDPWLGFSVEDEAGSIYNYDGHSWRSVTLGGDLWTPPVATVTITETGEEIQINNKNEEEIGWVRDILDENPGLELAGDRYVIRDYVLYRDGLIKVSAERGVIGIETGADSIILSRPQPTSYVWVEPGDDYVWLIDYTAAVLMVSAGEELAVAGRFVPDVIEGAVWEPALNTEILSGSVRQVFANIDGVQEDGGRKKIPFKVFVPGEAPPIRLDKIPTNNGPTITVQKYVPPKKECKWWKCVTDKVGDVSKSVGTGAASGFEKGWDGTVNLTGKALDKVDLKTADCATGIMAGVGCTLVSAEVTVDVSKAAYDFSKAVYEVRGNIFAEKDCHSPGPGRGPSGSPNNYEFPEDRTSYNLDGISTPSTQDFPDRLDLARLWMPKIEFSKDEQCGEVLRVFAKVHAYGLDGEQVNNLSRAERVEIVYTIFLKQDGGRYQILGADHPGDNEGFVIGLVRSNQNSGLCSTGFEFAGGRTVGHKDDDSILNQYLKATEREIDDFDLSEVGTPCPVKGDSRYRLLMSEAKHATYFHRDKCEDALIPDLPILAPALLFSGSSPEVFFVTVELEKKLLSLAPDVVKDNLRNGLEECESGRTLVDLSNRVELYDEELNSIYGDVLGFDKEFNTEEGFRSYAEKVRGHWCFGPDASSLPRVPDCGDDYHVANLFDVEAALPVASKQVPSLVYVPDVSNLGFTESEARRIIEDDGLQLQVAGIIDGPDSLVGTVVDQDPLPGDEVTEGTVVHVWIGVSSGPVQVDVPYLIGVTELQANNIASNLGLTIRVTGTIPTDASKAGLVVDQTPSSGKIDEGGIIEIWLGSVAKNIVPDLGGLTESVAINKIKAEGFVPRYGGTIKTTDSGFAGRVMDQDPLPGRAEPAGSTITYWLGEFSLNFPGQKTSPLVSVSISGGHGSVHSIGDKVDLCFSWVQKVGEPSDRWELWDFQPPGSSGVIIIDGNMEYAGSDCITATITGPVGFEQVIMLDRKFDYSTNKWEMRDWADIWIYVTE